MIPPVVASERGAAQTPPVATRGGGCRTAPSHPVCEENALERAAVAGESPVSGARRGRSGILSSAGHV